ncbi:MAG TPA: hypothetical protein PK765_03085 [bacterium]|nr:hypothetical protein [bacterium]
MSDVLSSEDPSSSALVFDTFSDRLSATVRVLERNDHAVDSVLLPPRFKPEDPEAFPNGILPEVFVQMRDGLHARLTSAIASANPPSVIVANYVAFTAWGIAELMTRLALSGAVPPVVVISCIADDLLARCAAK